PVPGPAQTGRTPRARHGRPGPRTGPTGARSRHPCARGPTGTCAALAPGLAATPLPPPRRGHPLRPLDPPPEAAVGRRGATLLRPDAALSAGDRLRRLLRAPAAAEAAVPPQPGPPRPHLVVRQAQRVDRPPEASLPPLRDRPRPLRRRPRQRRLEGRGRALFKLARRGAVRLLAERREYRDSRRQFWARHREHVARNGPEPMPPQFEPELWPMIAHRGSVESWHHRDRREVERDLVRAHARHLRRETQRRRERLRDLEAAVGCKSAQRALHQTDVDDATSAPPPEPRHCEDPGAAGVRGNPGPRDRRMRRGPGSPRRQTAARDDDGRETGLSEPTADAAPAPDAPAQPPGSDGDKPAQARVSLRPPPADPTIKIGAARSAIPQPLRDAGATRQVQNHPSGAASVPSGQAGTLARDAADRSEPENVSSRRRISRVNGNRVG